MGTFYELDPQWLRQAAQPCDELSYTARQHCSGESPWSPNGRLYPQISKWTMPSEASVYGPPDLSSRATSRRSSVSTGRHLTPTHYNRTLQSGKSHAEETFMVSSDQVDALETFDRDFTIDQSFLGIDNSSYYLVPAPAAAPIMANLELNTIREQTWGESNCAMPRSTSQQMAHHWPQSGHRVTGSWRMNDDRSWARDDRTPTQYAGAVHVSSEDVDGLKSTERRRNTRSNPKQERAPVQCVQCGQEFTGEFGAGNMRRHAGLKHAGERPTKYTCVVCCKSFNRSDALLGHKRKKHACLETSFKY